MSHASDIAAALGATEDNWPLRFVAEAGYLALYAGDGRAAQACFAGLVAAAPEDPVGHMGLAELHARSGAHALADEHAERAVRCDNVDAGVLAHCTWIRARAAIATGRRERALELCDASITYAPTRELATHLRELRDAL